MKQMKKEKEQEASELNNRDVFKQPATYKVVHKNKAGKWTHIWPFEVMASPAGMHAAWFPTLEEATQFGKTARELSPEREIAILEVVRTVETTQIVYERI